MRSIAFALSALVAVSGTVLAATALAMTHRVRQALGLWLDLLLAAGLLRLMFAQTWEAIAVVAVVVLLRKAAAAGIRSSVQARA